MHTGIFDSLCAFFHYTLYSPQAHLPESIMLLEIVQAIYIVYKRKNFYFSQNGWGDIPIIGSECAEL